MIRPFTCLTFLLALGSGLYLYQSKHRVKVLDEQIAQTVHATDGLREQTRMLSAEWTLLNDPERLRQLATQFLALQTVSPNQFTSLAELDGRLPAPVAPGSPPNGSGNGGPADQVPIAAAAPAGSGGNEGRAADMRTAASADTKIPASADTRTAASTGAPRDAAPSAQAAGGAATTTRVAAITSGDQAHAAEHKPPVPHAAAAQPRLAAYQPHPADQHGSDFRPADQRGADQRGADQHGADQRSADQHAADQRSADQRGSEQRVFEPRGLGQRVAETRPISAPRVPAAVSFSPASQAGGSMLGMAHGMAASPVPLPLPRPMPVTAPNWSYSNGG